LLLRATGEELRRLRNELTHIPTGAAGSEVAEQIASTGSRLGPVGDVFRLKTAGEVAAYLAVLIALVSRLIQHH
jgi:hypothetical protein